MLTSPYFYCLQQLLTNRSSLNNNLLQKMLTICNEETQPIMGDELSRDRGEDAREREVDSYSSMENEKKTKERECLLTEIKRKYAGWFVGVGIVLLTLLVFQFGLKYYLVQKRMHSFEHNLQVLGEYKQWKSNGDDQEQELEGKKLQFGRRTVPPKTQLQNAAQANQGNPITVQSSLLNSEQVKETFDFSPQEVKPIDSNLNPNLILPDFTQPLLNNQLTFDSTLPQDNLQLSTNTPQPVFSAVDPNINNQPAEQFANLPYRVQMDQTQTLIDYSNYTGITVDQVTNALVWMQLKFFSISDTNQIADAERIYYQTKYNIQQYQELPICVVVPTYNNAVNNRHINNMNSILMQEYSNYHIVFIDDASEDSTSEDITQLLQAQKKLDPSKYLLIKNSKQMHAMYNLRMAANSYCQPQDIFIIVDGDDQLIGRQVFKLFNAMFQRQNSWFVYSNFLTTQNYVGFSRLIPNSIKHENSYRQYPFVTSHLRAFYTQLFRNIREEDLRDANGEYLKAANDVAICLPILQQSQQRVAYIPQLTYYYNSQTGMNNHYLRLKQQKKNDLKLRQKPKYARLPTLFQLNPS